MTRKGLLIRDGFLTAAFLGLVWLAADKLADTAEERMSGQARVVDGDTLVLGKERIRLLGIDAPERAQMCVRPAGDWACGHEASRHLARLIGDDGVICRGGSRDRYGRSLSTCTSGGEVLNARMVSDGYAVAFGGYEREQAEARRAGRGIWSGSFDLPKEWRAKHGGMAEAPHMGMDGLKALLRHFEALWTTP